MVLAGMQIAAGFLWLPLLTSKGSLIAVAALFLISGIALVAVWPQRPVVRAALSVVVAATFVLLATEVPSLTAFTRFHSGCPMRFHEEGVQNHR